MLCESKVDHVILMKKAVELPFKELVEGPSPALKIEEICEASDDGVSIRRVYVNTDEGHPLAAVGWVHNEDVNACLICAQEFGLFRWKHHCRACGLLVCIDCTSTTVIEGHTELGEQTVCYKCTCKATAQGVPLTEEVVWGTEVYRAPDRPVSQDVVEVRAAPTTIQAEATFGFVIETTREEYSKSTTDTSSNTNCDPNSRHTSTNTATSIHTVSTDSADGTQLDTARVWIKVSHNAAIRDFYRVLTHNGHISEQEMAIPTEHTKYTIHTTQTDKVTPLVYVQGPCMVDTSNKSQQMVVYNVLVSSAYFDKDLIRDDSVLITHPTSINKIIQVINKNFNDRLCTTTYSLPMVPQHHLGGATPKDTLYTRSNCSVYNAPIGSITCVYDHAVPLKGSRSSNNSPYTLSGYSTRASSREDKTFEKFSLGLFSERVAPEADHNLHVLSLKAPSTLVGCEIICPYDPTMLADINPAYNPSDQTLLYIITHHKHTTMRGTYYRLCNVQTKKAKWVKLKRGPEKSGKEFYITRKYLGSPSEYGIKSSE